MRIAPGYSPRPTTLFSQGCHAPTPWNEPISRHRVLASLWIRVLASTCDMIPPAALPQSASASRGVKAKRKKLSVSAAPAAGGTASLARQCAVRDGASRLALHDAFADARILATRRLRSRLALAICALRTSTRRFLNSTTPRRLQRNACAARLAQADGDGLLRRTGAMLALADVFNFFMHKFAGGGSGRLAFVKIFARLFESRFVWH